MRAVAGAVRLQHRREDRAVAGAEGDGARHLAHDHRGIGGAQRRFRRHRHLVLARPVFRQEAVGREPGGADRAHHLRTEITLPTERIERIGRARPVLHPVMDELVLEACQQRQALPGECGDRAAQEAARAVLPAAAIEVLDVAEDEGFRRVVAERHVDMRIRIGADQQVAPGAERRRVDRPETRHHDVGMGEADPLGEPHRQRRFRERLAAHDPGPVAHAGEDQGLTRHAASPVRHRPRRRLAGCPARGGAAAE